MEKTLSTAKRYLLWWDVHEMEIHSGGEWNNKQRLGAG